MRPTCGQKGETQVNEKETLSYIAILETRLRSVEDRLEIFQLLATYGPAVDSRSGENTAALWQKDGSYDFGDEPLQGAEAIGALVDLDTHVGYLDRGCAHVMSLPMVTVDGNRASATNYSRVYVRGEAGWCVERAGVNRWELTRTTEGWRIVNRINRLADGSSAASGLLRRGLAEIEKGWE